MRDAWRVDAMRACDEPSARWSTTMKLGTRPRSRHARQPRTVQVGWPSGAATASAPSKAGVGDRAP